MDLQRQKVRQIISEMKTKECVADLIEITAKSSMLVKKKKIPHKYFEVKVQV